MLNELKSIRKILLIEDEASLRITLKEYLERSGLKVETASDGTEGLKKLGAGDFDLVITDIKLPGADGFEILNIVRSSYRSTDVVLITAYASVSAAVEAIKAGAYDYITKPFSFDQIGLLIKRLDDFRNVVDENMELKTEIEKGFSLRDIVYRSEKMRVVMDLVGSVAGSDAYVLITGETGTGKELIAEAIHFLSRRKEGRLVKINCAAIPDTLIESEMFGYEKGAFTGALQRKRGKLESAHKGTLFLDEVGDLSLSGQAKLLRAIEDRSFERVGGNETIKVDVRIISATRKNLRKLIEEGGFREDLYYRLRIIEIEIPPLRARREDIEPLIEYFIGYYSKKLRKEIKGIDSDLVDILQSYDYPGNVRELKNLIESAVTLCSDAGRLNSTLFPDWVTGGVKSGEKRTEDMSGTFPEDEILPLSEAIRRFEKDYLQRALRLAKGKKGIAASNLKISRKTLWEKLKELE